MNRLDTLKKLDVDLKKILQMPQKLVNFFSKVFFLEAPEAIFESLEKIWFTLQVSFPRKSEVRSFYRI